MRLHHAALIVFLAAPVLATAQDKIVGRALSGSPALGTYEDRIAVEDVMARYVWAVDSLDADGYVAVFTEDATIDSNGSISKGHAAIRGIVTSLIQRRDANTAKGLPTASLYHVVSNVHLVPEAGRGAAPVVLADRAARQRRQDTAAAISHCRRRNYRRPEGTSTATTAFTRGRIYVFGRVYASAQ